ncbi:colicin immunity domain-containing protein [Domibacillus aminovorans]|uniref:colicin immunity domain-containing protein n=1 Tax=Domibacillus aminovorans TaxID=29332 RepID=UPI0039F5AEA2
MMENFQNGTLSADEFQTLYFKVFKESNDRMDGPLFKILDGVFESADCYWHECLSGQETTFEISKQQLRKEVHEALVKLNKLLDNR